MSSTSESKYKKFYEDNKTRILKRQKEYRENNKTKLSELGKKYYEDNKARLKEKFDCECGGKYTYKDKAKHFKTKLHESYLEKQKETKEN